MNGGKQGDEGRVQSPWAQWSSINHEIPKDILQGLWKKAYLAMDADVDSISDQAVYHLWLILAMQPPAILLQMNIDVDDDGGPTSHLEWNDRQVTMAQVAVAQLAQKWFESNEPQNTMRRQEVEIQQSIERTAEAERRNLTLAKELVPDGHGVPC